ncbi:MAG: hypothetical protein ACK56F_17580, partial [bacterium]
WNRNKICFSVEVYCTNTEKEKVIHILAYKEFVLLLQCMFECHISISAFSSGEILWRIKKAT